jgi:hypothetical protein
MVRSLESGQRVTQVGDIFVMKMYNGEFGDYLMKSTIVEFEPGRRVTWEPQRIDVEGNNPWRHRWGYALEALDDARTEVSEFFDLSRSPDDARRILRDGERWRADMEKSLELLEQVVTTAK